MSEPHEPFYVRAVNRMVERGIIDDAARKRLLSSGDPHDANMALGLYQALLAVTLWPSNENDETSPSNAGPG